MSDPKRPSPAAVIRPLALLLVISAIAYFTWRYFHRREGYRGGAIETTGTVEAVQVRLGFQVGGRIAEVLVSEGDRVQPGQVVARLDPQDFTVQVESARAALASARAAVEQARANRDRSRLDLNRVRELLSRGYATPEQMDTVLATSKVTEAQVSAAEAQVRQAESALDQTRLQLSYVVLRAAEGGVVSEKIHRPGEIVTATAPVVSIAYVDTVKVHAAVDETRVGAVRVGDPVIVRVYTFDRRTFPGVVSDVMPVGDFATRKDWGAQRRDIRTFDVTARVPNPEHLLKDGMTAEVRIEVSPSVQAEARAQR
jgi:RND family efflux transporter MFP subunit